MAGQLTISTLSDGVNSTSSTNCIQGSAKAWANFTNSGSAITVRASYNVSSFTFTNAYTFTMNFTNALTDANYVVLGLTGSASSTGTTGVTMPWTPSNSSFSSKTNTAVTLNGLSFSNTNPSFFDNNIVVFR